MEVTFGEASQHGADVDQVEAVDHEIGEPIGRGGMGMVLRARDRSLDRDLAMKVILPGASRTSIARFRREALVLARLEHPNIVPIHEIGTTRDGRPFYTMKLVKGRTLQSILTGIREGDEECVASHPLSTLLGVFRKVCDAVAFAHSRGVVHRDLKPDNIMVGEFGEVLLMDWGLAKLLEEPDEVEEEINASSPLVDQTGSDLTLEGQILGTPLYMAPEQALGHNEDIGPCTDIYSLGGILQAILTLRPPFEGGALPELLERIEKGQRTPIPLEEDARLKHCHENRVPSSLVAAVNRAMAVTSTERYATVLQLSADVGAFSEGYATSVERPSLRRRIYLFTNRNKAAVTVFLIGLVVACYTYFFSLLYLRSEQRRLIEEKTLTDRDFRALRWSLLYDEADSMAAAEAGWEDLVPGILADRSHPDTGRWILNRDRIGSPPGKVSHLRLPIDVSGGQYRLKVQLRKLFNGKSFSFLLPVGDRYCRVFVDAPQGKFVLSGVALDEGAGLVEPLHSDRVFRNNEVHELVLEMDSSSRDEISLRLSFDGSGLFRWTGSPKQLMTGSDWLPEETGHAYLAADGGNWLIEGVAFSAQPH